MASPTSLDDRANRFPAAAAWIRCDQKTSSFVVMNSIKSAPNRIHYPLQLRLRFYVEGEIFREHFTEDIPFGRALCLNLNTLLEGTDIMDGYLEATLFSLSDEGLKEKFFTDLWASVVSADGSTAVNFPFLLTYGDDPPVLDACYQIYPGINVDESFSASLVVLNHYSFDNPYEIILYDASGQNELRKKMVAPAKSSQRTRIDELFSEAAAFFRDGPGMIIVHHKYKMPAFLQTLHATRGTLCGMDHFSYIFNLTEDTLKTNETKIENTLKNRLQDRVVCVCRSISEGEILEMRSKGLSLCRIQEECEAGLVCHGCVAELEALTGEVSPSSAYTR